MYQNHVPKINAAMRACPEAFARGIMFAVLSARTQFVTVADQMRELDRDGMNARCLFNWKRGAYEYVTANKHDLWRKVCATNDSEHALMILCQIPGLGIVKAAFVLQFLGHDIACLDVRNIQREGLPPRAYRTDGKKSGPAFERKVARYVAQTRGRAQELWDAWCEHVGGIYGLSAQMVSAEHLKIIPRHLRNVRPVAPAVAQEIPF